MSCFNSTENTASAPRAFDWIDISPVCTRSVSRIVDLELRLEEFISDLLQDKEAG